MALQARYSRLCAVMDAFEPRLQLSAATPSDYEQYMLELINRARANPTAEAARYSIDLNEGVPAVSTISTDAKQPLAFNPYLIDAARGHSQDMIAHDYFAHDSFDGTAFEDRFTAAGYVFNNQGYGDGENIAWRGSTPDVPPLQSTTAQLDQDLFVDAGYDGRGHRINMLFGDFKEIGIGIVYGSFYDAGQDQTFNAVMATEDFAYNANTVFLTGVAYSDDNNNQFYDPREGIGGLTITAVRDSDNATFSTTAFSTGGYTIPIEAGTYTVTASGPGLSAPMVDQNVVIGQDNVEVDFVGPAAQGAPQITGNVYDDLNRDGLFTPGEGLAGLTVTALRTAGGTAVSAGTTTSSTGAYALNVASGTYKVTVTGAALDAPIVVQNVVVGNRPVNVDVVKPPAQINGVVYDDLNYDHRYTSNEGLGGLTVSAAPASEDVPVVATTSAAGGYILPLEP
ncbi:MAG: SdrD B-like domain-containing protein, partial [Tepidisphaeraceae bacterium]